MLVSIGFLLLIVVMSAFLAVLADNVGRKLGKQRRSYKCRHFSVRPKHVAQIGTALTGAAVSFATIALVTIISKDVRDWIVRGRAAIAEAAAATKRSDLLAAQIGERESTIRVKDQEIQKKTAEIGAKTKEVEAGRREVEKQKRALESLRAEVGRLRTEIPRLRGEVAIARKNVVDADRRLKEREARLIAVRRSLSEVNRLLKQNVALLEETTIQKNEFTRENTDLRAKNLKLERQRQDLQSSIDELEKERSQLQKARDEAIAELERTQEDLEAQQQLLGMVQADLRVVQADLRDTERQLRDAKLAGSFFREISTNPRVAPMTFRMQEEVARLGVEEGLSLANAETAMAKLLREARLEAIRRGAQPNDEYPEAGIFERRDPETKETVSGEELQRRLVHQIVGSRQPLVLVAYSSLNAFKGEPVSLDVVVYPNPLVYKNGQLVAESRVDGRRDDAEIYRQISEFLGAKLQERIRQDRMIPRQGAEDQFGLAPVPGGTVLKLVGDVKAAERPVRLLALAASDTRAGDSLKLSFQIR